MSFRLKTILGIASIEAVLLVILIWSGLDILSHSNEEALKERAMTTASLFATTTKNAVLATDLASLESFITEVLKIPGLSYARVIGQGGIVLAEGGDATSLARPFIENTEVIHDDPDQLYDTFSEIIESGHVYGRVEIGISYVYLKSLLADAKQQSLLIAFIELLLVATFSYFLGLYLTRQLKVLEVASREIAHGDIGLQIPVQGSDELAQTSAAFNYMSGKLQQLYSDLSDKEQRVRAIMDNATDAIIIIREDGLVDTFNPSAERIFGCRADNIIGRPFDTLVRDWMPSDHDIREGSGVDINTRQLSLSTKEQSGDANDKREYYVEMAISSMILHNDKYHIAIIRDITERKKAERSMSVAREEAEQASRSKSDFLALMSHEIRTPLNAILGINNLLHEGKLNEEQKYYINLSTASGKSLLSIVNDILDFNKLESGKLRLEKEDFSIRDLTAYIHNVFEADLKNKDVILSMNIADDVPEIVSGDSGRLQQVLFNLVGNAVKFTSSGSISIAVKLSADYHSDKLIQFEVADTGIGFDNKIREKLFDEFVQADPSFSRNYGGAGLGLSIARKLVTMMNGSIDCHSEVGKGSVFSFVVELSDKTENADSVEDINDNDSLIDRKFRGRVLVAEDSQANQVVISAMLKSAGLGVDIVANGYEAIRSMQALPYDLILMDVAMPEMDGLEATTLIRGMDSARDVPIIAMTANVRESDKERCFSAGMDDFIEKPINKASVYAVLSRWLDHVEVDVQAIQNEKHQQSERGELLDVNVLRQLAEDTSQEMVPGMIKIFIKETCRRLEHVRLACMSNDADIIEDESHVLKSSSGTYGALRLQEIASAAHTACRDGRKEDAMSFAKSMLATGCQSLLDLAHLYDLPEPECLPNY